MLAEPTKFIHISAW